MYADVLIPPPLPGRMLSTDPCTGCLQLHSGCWMHMSWAARPQRCSFPAGEGCQLHDSVSSVSHRQAETQEVGGGATGLADPETAQLQVNLFKERKNDFLSKLGSSSELTACRQEVISSGIRENRRKWSCFREAGLVLGSCAFCGPKKILYF